MTVSEQKVQVLEQDLYAFPFSGFVFFPRNDSIANRNHCFLQDGILWLCRDWIEEWKEGKKMRISLKKCVV
jgi:hypothetical protein